MQVQVVYSSFEILIIYALRLEGQSPFAFDLVLFLFFLFFFELTVRQCSVHSCSCPWRPGQNIATREKKNL